MLDLIQAYENYLKKVKQASANTIASYMRDIRQFAVWLHDTESMDVIDVTQQNIAQYLAFLEEEGYRNISKSDVRDYVEGTDPENYKFSVREDGEICLIIDQEISFFSSADEILEIPLEDDAAEEGE